MIFAIDFDGTLVTHEYPRIGRDVGGVPVVQRLLRAGHQVILLTMRSGETLKQALQWLDEKGVQPDSLYGVNENPDQHTWTESPKVFAHVYIDDAAFGAPLIMGIGGERPYVDWKEIERQFEKLGVFKR